ncbi:MAG: hypothetical protein AABX29_03875 [Nanoarchaeota archaeon]
MKQNNSNICIACQEAITNPVCQDCLEEEIETWLKKREPKLIPRLRKQTEEFKAITISEGSVPCIFCKNDMNSCAYCYTGFIEEWLRKKHPRLVPEFKLFFDFG